MHFLRTYLLAIALPALLLALFGAALLRTDARARAATVADNARLHAERASRELQARARALIDPRLDRIASAPSLPARIAALRDLAASDPYVRNAFLWRENEGCVWPRRTGATEEERRFLNRCEPLFSGAVPWTLPPTNAPASQANAAPPPLPARGYRAWAIGDRHELLAWVRTAPGELCGFEFETVRYLADLASAWPETGCAQSLAMRRKWGRTARQAAPQWLGSLLDASTGATLVPPVAETAPPTPLSPSGEALLLPLFPDWRYRLDPNPLHASPAASRLALGAVLFALLLLSLVAGGAVLLRAARRERLDALRKTDFVSNVSHELRTPLTAIRTYAELLAEGRLPDPARRRRALDVISAESARLSRLVDTLLDFARLERNRRTYTPVPLDLAALAAEIAEASPVRPACIPPPSPVPALADRDAVRQIVLNLLDNAAKYAPGAPPELAVALLPDGTPSLSVLDRGPGIPPRAARRIFDRFVRLDDATTRTTSGYGLGLSIARRLARGMNGDLTYHPRPQGGSAFTLTLPPPSSPNPPVPPAPPVPPVPVSGVSGVPVVPAPPTPAPPTTHKPPTKGRQPCPPS